MIACLLWFMLGCPVEDTATVGFQEIPPYDGPGLALSEHCRRRGDWVPIRWGSAVPELDSDAVSRAVTVEAVAVGASAEAELWLLGPGGRVDGVSVRDGDTLRFEPSALLAADSSFTVMSCTEPVWSFRTGHHGGTVGAGAIGSATWRVDLWSGRWRSPVAIPGLIGPDQSRSLLIEVAVSPTSLVTMTGAITESGAPGQDLCVPTWSYNAQFVDPQLFALAEDPPPIPIDNLESVALPIGLDLFATADAEGRWLDAELRGEFDAEPFGALISDPDPPETACELFASLGDACEPCSDGRVLCFAQRVDRLPMAATSENVVPVSPQDVAADPGCG